MLRTRVSTAVVCLAVFLSALFLFSRIGWIGFCAAILGVAAWEWGKLAGFAMLGRYLYSALLVVPLLSVEIGDGSSGTPVQIPPGLYYASAFFWAVLVPLWLWRGPRVGSAPMLVVGAIALVPAFTALVDLRTLLGPAQLVAVLAIVWISDSAAYFVGSAFGRHKLAPSISPGKTWEGVLGAVVAVGIYATAWLNVAGSPGLSGRFAGLPGGAVWFVAALVGLAAIGMIGDLFESLIKRQAGVKDSGTLLPGHGGMLDRVDAPLAMLPLALLVFTK